jgi:hypothetical protein
MTATIVMPALVRRYLLATGWTAEQFGDRLAWTRPDGSSCWSSVDAVPVMLNAAPPLRADEYGARLGMLAAAEMDLETVRSGIRDYASTLEMAAYAKIRRAGVDPEAWEKARQHD